MTTVKVIHVIAGLKKVGGAELMLKRLIETQNGGSEFEHSIISLSDLGEFGQGLIEAGISVDVLGMTSMRDMPRVLLRLIGIFRERRPDIVQTWMYHSDLLGGLAARMAGIGGIIWGVRTTDLQEGGKSTTVLVRKVCAWLSGFLPKYIVCAAAHTLLLATTQAGCWSFPTVSISLACRRPTNSGPLSGVELV
ncbi:glycosyltransferase [Pseudomonas aeruginosa]|uniref:glycosyltransferase n=1 Tax=Pseudomonas aeruginosa TaxID=287 RepID=UPI003D9C271C